MTNQDYFALASLTLNVVWFLYAMFNSRFLRNHVRKVERNIFDAAPAIHTDALELHFRKKRNRQGLMLVQAIHGQLRQQPPKRTEPIDPSKSPA